MARMRISTFFKKWDLLVTLEGKYVCNGFIYTNISRAPRVECTHVASKFWHTMSVYIAHEQFIRHQPVVCTRARIKDFCTRVVRVLLYTHVFVKFKSSCTVGVNDTVCLQNKMRHSYVQRHSHLLTAPCRCSEAINSQLTIPKYWG